jgi:TPR repeat protein
MVAFGKRLYEGDGVEKDEDEAVRLFNRAADAGDVDASVELGLIAINDDDTESAIEHLRKAVDGDSAFAAGVLGDVLLGEGEHQDVQEGLRLLEIGAEAGFRNFQARLGALYFAGDFDLDDQEEANKWLELAVAKGDFDSMALLGYQYENGIGTEQDVSRAAELYSRAENRSPRAKLYLAGLYSRGEGVTKNTSKAKQQLQWVIANSEDEQLKFDAQELLDELESDGDAAVGAGVGAKATTTPSRPRSVPAKSESHVGEYVGCLIALGVILVIAVAVVG